VIHRGRIMHVQGVLYILYKKKCSDSGSLGCNIGISEKKKHADFIFKDEVCRDNSRLAYGVFQILKVRVLPYIIRIMKARSMR
jgi:hypothetical protein